MAAQDPDVSVLCLSEREAGCVSELEFTPRTNTRTEAGRDSGENKTSISARAAAVLIKSLLGCCSSSGFDFLRREREKIAHDVAR